MTSSGAQVKVGVTTHDSGKTMQYSFRSKLWKYQGPAGWHFVTLPKLLSRNIRKQHGSSEEGWGRLKATAKIGKSKWNTSIWYDSKAGGYLLPVKSAVRKKEQIDVNDRISVNLVIENEDPKFARLLGRA